MKKIELVKLLEKYPDSWDIVICQHSTDKQEDYFDYFDFSISIYDRIINKNKKTSHRKAILLDIIDYVQTEKDIF